MSEAESSDVNDEHKRERFTPTRDNDFKDIDEKRVKGLPSNEIDGVKRNSYYMRHSKGIKSIMNSLGQKKGFENSTQQNFDLLTAKGEMTGIEEIDRIMKIKFIPLKKDSLLVDMYGCGRCWWKGTDKCPHLGEDKVVSGYCTKKIKHVLMQYRAMRSLNGKKFLRDLKIQQMIRMLDYYETRLMKIKDSEFSKEHEKIFDRVAKMWNLLSEYMAKAIKQDEGMTIKHERDITPSELNRLISRSREKVIEAEVIDNDDKEEEKRE